MGLVGHFSFKPIFLRLPEMLYSDDEGSKYRVTALSFVKSLALGLLLPMVFAICILMMKEDRAFYYSNEWKYR